MEWNGYCLTGETKEQKMMFHLGHSAENGKSTIAKIMATCYSEYTFKIDRKTFLQGYQKAHKQLSGIENKRYVYSEELERQKLDADLLKDIVDGDSINNEKLFDTFTNIIITCKLNFMSNYDPVFNTDEGLRRHGLCSIYKNKFLDERLV
jgi:putative DNA primase/helicase